MALESTIFKQKSPHKFSVTDASNLIIAGLHTLTNLFHYKTQKKPRLFALYFNFQVNLAEVSLNDSYD